MREDVVAAANVLAMGELVVYPTETVYGLGGDALARDTVERVYELKGRSRDNPLSMAVPDVDTALEHTEVTDREERFMREFLPGPVTVVVEREGHVPDALTAGKERVGIRIPDHEVALDILDRFAPITATSANLSGQGSITHPDDLPEEIREGVAVVVDDGETPGTESTVVDVGLNTIHRRGAQADAVEEWLDAN